MKKVENAFDWDIKQQPILDMHGNPLLGYKEIKRDDNDRHIAVKADTFHPMTTQEFSETVAAVADKIGGTVKEFKDWDTTNRNTNIGKAKPVITAQMEISEPLEIAGSKIEGKLTLGVGFSGNRSFFIGHTNTYLRCTNQFASIVKDFTSRLTKNNMVRIEEIIQNIELYREYEEKLYENFKKFQDVKIDERLVQECVARLVGMNDEEKAMSESERKNEFSTQRLNKIDDILFSVRNEMADPALGNTAWGLFNGVTHYTTYVMSNRGISQEMSTMFGAKKEANHIAYDMCAELINS